MINVWELFTCLPEEVKYLWSAKFTVMKALYFFSRYYIFVLHGQQFLYGDVLENVAPSLRTVQCIAMWITYKGIAVQTLLWGVDFALFKRVYLLFGGDRKMLYVLLLLGTIRLGLDIYLLSSFYLAAMKADFASIYSDVPLFAIMLTFASGETIIQIITALLIRKGERLSRTQRTPVRVRLLDHGIEPAVIWILGLVSPALALYSIDISSSLFPIVTTGLSVSGCRLILCMHRAYHRSKRTTFDHISAESSSEEDT